MNSNTSSITKGQDTNDKEKRIVNGETGEMEEKLQNEEMLVEIEPKTGISFSIKLSDGKQLKAMGVRKKKLLGFSIRIYSFGIYADNQKLVGVMKSKIVESPTKTTKEMYRMVIDSAVGITVKMVIVFANLTMSMVRKNFNEGLAAAIRKLGGEKNEELMKRAYVYLYLGDDPLDKEAKEKFGMSLISLF
ncbi:Chalcone isomerase [Cynara cardunculus var. scolymus]|uniref:Chalcone isomerase n=1 Tax=Cynara cardunculus var. scolymus TaxID=59895 RepID=A0A103XLC9_CYNCS|nr:Chalcone isomerase [Cynara cardunculus var. scolymus]